MTATINTELQRALEAMSVPGILVDHRLIAEGDEDALLPAEARPLGRSVPKVRRASGAARIVARSLLSRLGKPPGAIVRSPSGAPVWPEGIVGSLAHDAVVAVAAVARRRDFASLGIDVEPAAALDVELLDVVATPRERERIGRDPLQVRLLFSVKEAVYKAVYPLDGTFLDHHDVEVDFAAGQAVVRSGRRVTFRCSISTSIVSLAFIPAISRKI
jgi:4'-phosphopantetheinyl transferase EntD